MRRPEPGARRRSPGCGPTASPASRAVGHDAQRPRCPTRAGRAERRRRSASGADARRPSAAPAGRVDRVAPVDRPHPRRPARASSTDADDLDATPQESALAWLRFAGELVIALAAGVGVYFAATLLWENIPHVAVLLAPLAVTGLVTGVGVWRQRQGREPVGPRLLAILVFAGTLLTIAPAAGLLAGGS